LRHLPGLLLDIYASAREYLIAIVEQNDPDAGAVARIKSRAGGFESVRAEIILLRLQGVRGMFAPPWLRQE
jgi:hypothetical protein